MKEEEIKKGDCGLRMVRWCIRLTRLTLVCEVIRYRLVQIRQNLKKSPMEYPPESHSLFLSCTASSRFEERVVEERLA